VKSSTKTISFLLVFSFIGTGIYFSAMKTGEFFRPRESTALGKAIPVKPKNLRDRKKQVAPVSREEGFTFFDTLGDPALSKLVDLDGNIVELRTASGDRSKVLPLASVTKEELETSVQEPFVEKKTTTISPVVPREKPIDAGFRVQVGSFHQLKRAKVLEEKLKGRGYPVYVAEAKNPVAEEIWYRVFVGLYKDKQLALGMAFQIKEQENLSGVVVWQEG
jgi:hypothetical protein